MVQVALLQLDTSARLQTVDPAEEALSRIESVARQVLQLPTEVELVLLPELWPVGAFDVEGFVGSAQGLDGELVTGMSDVARSAGVWLHAGSFIERRNDEYYNTSLVFDDSGNLVAKYRKMHLFGFGSGEARVLSGGSDVVVVDTPIGRTGLSTCYDLRFPELYRAQRAVGAQSFLVPTGWPAARISVWRTLAAARALENQAWLLGCNAVGDSAGVQMGGQSVVITPDGQEKVVGADSVEQVLSAQVDLSAVTQLREQFPVNEDRRIQ